MLRKSRLGISPESGTRFIVRMTVKTCLRVERALISLGEKEITDFIKAGKDVEIHCDFCDTDYVFNPDELTEILKKSRALKK